MIFRKWTTLAAWLFLLLLFPGCGKTVDKTGIEGIYKLSCIEEKKTTLPISLTKDSEVFLEICEGGSGILHLRESNGSFRWSYSSGSITIMADGWEAKGNVEDRSLLLTFPSEAQALFTLSSDEDLHESEQDLDAGSFPGNWYGWLKTDSESGLFPDSWFDCCAKVTAMGDNSFRIVLWDEDGSLQDPLGEITMILLPDGSAVSENGYFCYADISKDEWKLLPPDSFSPATLQITDCEHNAMDETFSYSFFMHPWGTVWENSSDSSADIFLPFYYYDWYLPLIEKKAEMPERIPWEMLEEQRSSEITGDESWLSH